MAFEPCDREENREREMYNYEAVSVHRISEESIKIKYYWEENYELVDTEREH